MTTSSKDTTNGDEDDYFGALGAFIKTQRNLANLTQRELAKLTNLSDPYVSQIERGLHEPSLRVVRAMAMALNLPIETMLAYAGLRSDDEADASQKVDTESVIRCDDALDEDQKQALLGVYRSFLGANEAVEGTDKKAGSKKSGSKKATPKKTGSKKKSGGSAESDSA